MDLAEMAQRIQTASGTMSRFWAQDFKRSKASGDLTSTQFAILAFLERSGTLTVSQLAELLDLSVPTVVRAVDALERKLLVERRHGTEDRREVWIARTPEGERVRAALERRRSERLQRLLARMGKAEIEGLVSGLEALALAAQADREEEAAV